MERRAIAVRGLVQGVGFRPFIYALAVRLRLRGFVQNRVGDVLIEVEGEGDDLDQFLSELATHPPPLAHIDHVAWESRPQRGERHFAIYASAANHSGAIFVSPDVATCADCLAELAEPSDRRYRYPFLNCTNCGPRLTIVTGAPYDRPRTTMVGFAMCPACCAEYDDPANRRYHAQPTCCPACGPRLLVLDGKGQPLATDDPMSFFAEALRAGKIGALKGLGGYHLSCDARSSTAVAELRRRKQRDEKPFALMVQDVSAAETFCVVSATERELLCSRRRPIVLLRKVASVPGEPSSVRSRVAASPSSTVTRPLTRLGSPCNGTLADEIAPGNPTLGVMLPYTPVHHLLLRAVGGIPLVMTSGNRADEPIAYDDADAVQRLAGIADWFLVHDRPIHVRCDDSVTRVVDGVEMPIRRSRGYAPEPIALPMACPLPIVAVGGQLKGTFAVGRDRHAVVSHHLGDLDNFEAYQAFVKDLALYEELFGIKPQLLVHDLHPDYASTRYARARGETEGIPVLGVQHHHAHMASCMAEHGLTEPAIGVSFDGTGYGTDGAIWGGEFLVGAYAEFSRAAHFRYVGMAGAEQAIREPWRMALAHLLDAGESDGLLAQRVARPALRTVRHMLERRVNTPLTSSVGRLFDAVAALATGRVRVSFEGQAAMELEWLAGDTAGDDSCYPWEIEDTPAGLVVDTRPLMSAVAADVRRGQDGGVIARRFHATMADVIVAVCERIRQKTRLHVVVLSGGVFMNARLTHTAVQRLSAAGFCVYRHHKVPTNDGGLSLGQLAIAAAVAGASDSDVDNKGDADVPRDSRQGRRNLPRA